MKNDNEVKTQFFPASDFFEILNFKMDNKNYIHSLIITRARVVSTKQLYKMSLPKMSTLMPILFNNEDCRKFLIENQVFYDTMICPSCKMSMTCYPDRDSFRCLKRTCRKEVSMRKYSFFFGSALNCSQIMLLGYLWLNQCGQLQAMNISGHSSGTITSFFRNFRSLVASTLVEEDQVIGVEKRDQGREAARQNNSVKSNNDWQDFFIYKASSFI